MRLFRYMSSGIWGSAHCALCSTGWHCSWASTDVSEMVSYVYNIGIPWMTFSNTIFVRRQPEHGIFHVVGLACNCVLLKMRKIYISKKYIIQLYCFLPCEDLSFSSCFVLVHLCLMLLRLMYILKMRRAVVFSILDEC